MDKIKLSLGDKLEIELYNNNGESISPLLVSQYERLLPDGSMEIMAPIHGGRIYPVYRGAKMDVIYEKNKELYKFNAEAIERSISGKIFLLRIMPKSDEEHMQRRFFFRFTTVLDVKYRIFEDKETKEENRGEFRKGITKDISGGGICLLANEKPTYGWYIEGIFNVESDVRFLGQIVRAINIHDKGKFRYEIGVEFIDIKELEREKVISFIFDSQRKLLKRGWSTK